MSDPQVTNHDHDGAIVRRAVIERPAAELYAVLADPHRHHEVDGGGTVGQVISGTAPLQPGDRFAVKMSMFGVPYRITSTVTAATPGEVIEWRHPFGHRWRWELAELPDGRTQVTHSFVYGASPIGAILRRTAGRANGAGMTGSLINLAHAA